MVTNPTPDQPAPTETGWWFVYHDEDDPSGTRDGRWHMLRREDGCEVGTVEDEDTVQRIEHLVRTQPNPQPAPKVEPEEEGLSDKLSLFYDAMKETWSETSHGWDGPDADDLYSELLCGIDALESRVREAEGRAERAEALRKAVEKYKALNDRWNNTDWHNERDYNRQYAAIAREMYAALEAVKEAWQ